MKKLHKLLPLLIIPFFLTSCGSLFPLSNDSSEVSENDGNVYPTGLIITGVDSIVAGTSSRLNAIYSPDNVTNTTVTWTSSNTSVLTVEIDGKITGRSAGSATVTASMKGPKDTKVTATKDITVTAPDPTGVVISASTMSIGFNKTKEIYASTDPFGADNHITWTTSNSLIVSLSKTSTYYTDQNNPDKVTLTAGSSVGTATITATSVEDPALKATCTVNVTEVTGTTVMLYVCGADLESESGLASMDIDEILSVNEQPEDVNIILQTGGANSWNKSQISASKSQKWEIRNRQLIQKSSTTKKNMGLTSSLQEFLTWGLSNYPAENYGLILWNHGGAMGGVCFDEQFNDSITADECYTAVTNARNACGVTDKLEWITYDACLMAVQDVAEYNSYNFNYMLSSQESEGGYGYDYDAWLPTLYANPDVSTPTLLQKIGHTFLVEEDVWYDDQTQSVYDLSKMNTYKTAFESFASSLNTTLGSSSNKLNSFISILNNAQKYGASEDDYGDTVYGFDVFDVESVLNKMKTNSNFSGLSTEINAVLTALDNLVIYEEHLSGTTGCGINLFCPISHYNYSYNGKPLSGHGPETNFTNWSNVAEKVFNSWY